MDESNHFASYNTKMNMGAKKDHLKTTVFWETIIDLIGSCNYQRLKGNYCMYMDPNLAITVPADGPAINNARPSVGTAYHKLNIFFHVH